MIAVIFSDQRNLFVAIFVKNPTITAEETAGGNGRRMQPNQAIKLAILRALQELGGPAGASRLLDRISADGAHLQPRTIRHYLLQLDREGFTRFINRRRGRELTPRGREELGHANIIERLGFVGAKIDALGYRMNYRLASGHGTIITNIAFIKDNFLARALEYMKPVFARHLCMGTKLAVVRAGETLGGLTVPPGMVALGTVCSMTVNGILLAERIPVTSRFGGLLELREDKPVRFLELLEYRGTTIDPLEFFINANMTRVRDCARTGSGIIGASFREIPNVALDEVQRLVRQMEKQGLASVLALGRPNQPLLQIPVAEGRTGLIVVGGMNPFAALREAGAQLQLQSLAGLEDFSSFLPFYVVRDRFSG
jgi:repressor of nif and glnA expression